MNTVTLNNGVVMPMLGLGVYQIDDASLCEQIVRDALRFTLQRGVIVIPKTVHKDRLIENMAVWDFELDGEDMSQITALDTGRTEIIDHLTVDMVQFLNRHKIHE